GRTLSGMRGVAVGVLVIAGCAPASRSAPPAVVGVNARPPSAASHIQPAAHSAPSSRGEEPSWWVREARSFERSARWELDIIVDLAGRRVPDTRVPYRFDLRMQVFYERVGRSAHVAVPVEGEPLFSFEQNVCFRPERADSRRFRVPLVLGREHGFVEGEYDLTIMRVDT